MLPHDTPEARRIACIKNSNEVNLKTVSALRSRFGKDTNGRVRAWKGYERHSGSTHINNS